MNRRSLLASSLGGLGLGLGLGLAALPGRHALAAIVPGGPPGGLPAIPPINPITHPFHLSARVVAETITMDGPFFPGDQFAPFHSGFLGTTNDRDLWRAFPAGTLKLIRITSKRATRDLAPQPDDHGTLWHTDRTAGTQMDYVFDYRPGGHGDAGRRADFSLLWPWTGRPSSIRLRATVEVVGSGGLMGDGERVLGRVVVPAAGGPVELVGSWDD